MGVKSPRCWGHWRDAVARENKAYGPANTRTLADVVPLTARMERDKLFPHEEVRASVLGMVRPMREIAKELQSKIDEYLTGNS